MFRLSDINPHPRMEELASKGYWVAMASRYLEDGKYSKTVEVCKENIPQYPNLLSAHLIYAKALYLAGQMESAAEQFYYALSLDADNLVALKYLGDIKFATNDKIGAMAHYQKILEIDPDCHALFTPLAPPKKEVTRTISLKRSAEISPAISTSNNLRKIHFYTETIGDLYFAQGYSKMAAEVYRILEDKNHNPRLKEKLKKAQEKIKEKEHHYVKKQN